ncbi:alpha/beta fold hydrolase [Cyclobacteriaceae bacterium]|jgi:pimeloyl-ACP methyl ester carboxylesterase|nr:alpha/beta fold hydrolase [Cyclobacteriaceae bacterium]HAQ71231.1 alpha/beta hydrolase [Flavobacteriales bacterium]
MKLHFKKFGSGPPLIILHGVFGSSDNWKTLANHLMITFEVYLVDQRNHGLSPHSDDLNYQVMTDDLKELLHNEQIEKCCLLGHSMGGKTAMNFAVQYPEKIMKLIIVDIAPKRYPPHHQNILQGVHSLKINEINTRKEADDLLSTTINNSGIRQFILKNLSRNPEGLFYWKINWKAIEDNIQAIGAPLLSHDLFTGEVLFIRGAQSDYILNEDEPLLKKHFPNAVLMTIQKAGHWVHAEQPAQLLALINQFIKYGKR